MANPASPMPLFKVASTSGAGSVAGAIAGSIRERGRCELQAIGAGAVNQAIKAIAIARGYVAPGGLDLSFVPAFHDLVIAGEERTAIKLMVQSHPKHPEPAQVPPPEPIEPIAPEGP